MMRDPKDKLREPHGPEDPEGPRGYERPRIGRQLLIGALIVGGLLVAISLVRKVSQPLEEEVEPGQFLSYMESGQVAELRVESPRVRGKLRPIMGADLEALVNEAAILAAVRGLDEVHIDELEDARDKVRFGRQKKRSRIMSDEDRRMTAYHEAGHALIAKLDKDVEPLHKVTIIPRGVVLGMTMVLPEKDKYGLRKRECIAAITMNMAGRVAEEMFCGDISSGAESDIKTATDLARRMVTRWGMSESLGPISYSDEEQHVFLGNEITRGKVHSDQMAERIDHEVQSILMDCYKAARQVCEKHAQELQRVAEALLELETLTGDEVDAIFEGATVQELEARRKVKGSAGKAAEPAPRRPGDDPAAGGQPHPAASPA